MDNTTDKIIYVTVKTVYGNDLVYPTTHIDELSSLTGKKTLSKKHIDALKQLGFTVKVKTPDVEF